MALEIPSNYPYLLLYLRTFQDTRSLTGVFVRSCRCSPFISSSLTEPHLRIRMLPPRGERVKSLGGCLESRFVYHQFLSRSTGSSSSNSRSPRPESRRGRPSNLARRLKSAAPFPPPSPRRKAGPEDIDLKGEPQATLPAFSPLPRLKSVRAKCSGAAWPAGDADGSCPFSWG